MLFILLIFILGLYGIDWGLNEFRGGKVFGVLVVSFFCVCGVLSGIGIFWVDV